MPIKSYFSFRKNKKTKSKIKASSFTRRKKHTKRILKNKKKNFRKFSMQLAGMVREEHVYEESRCPICLEDYGDPPDKPIQILNCNHGVHLNCIEEWVRKNPYQVLCPLCKDPITIKSIVDIANEAKRSAQNALPSSAVLARLPHLTHVPVPSTTARENYETYRARLDRQRRRGSSGLSSG